MSTTEKLALTSKDINFLSVISQHKKHSHVSRDFLLKYISEAYESKKISKDACDVARVILDSDNDTEDAEKKEITDKFCRWVESLD